MKKLKNYLRMIAILLIGLLVFTSGSSISYAGVNVPSDITMVHLGAANNKESLDYAKSKIQAKEEPWMTKYYQMKSKAVPYTKTTSPQDGNENAQKEDAILCYANALTWYITGDETYAKNAIAVLNVWAKTFNGYSVPPVGQGNQSQLNAAWIGTLLGPAAEIMRTYEGWSKQDIESVKTMFKTKFYPALNQMSTWNGNVDLTQADAMLNIAVFCDDPEEFKLGIERLEARIPQYFYLESDPIPTDRGLWFNPTKWVSGLTQETCRDNGHHAQFALAATLQAAEVAWNQGVDIYGENQERLMAAMELLAKQIVTGSMQGVSANDTTTRSLFNTFEIGYNHYHNRKGFDMPYTTEVIKKVRGTSNNDWNIFYETLTHGRDLTSDEVVNEKPLISGARNRTIYIGEAFDPLNGVTATDKEDGDITKDILVTGTVDTNTSGIYPITYRVTDSFGNIASVTVNITVEKITADVNKDGIINVEDLALVSSKYNAKFGDEDFEIKLDINTDKVIDVYDLVFVAKGINNGDGGGGEIPSTEWSLGVNYKVGDIITYKGKSYKCIFAHTSHEGWLPDQAFVIWQPI